MSVANGRAVQRGSKGRMVRKRVSSLKPSPENEKLYDAKDDEELADLAESIRTKGLLQHLVITLDNFIVSGHRRHAALVILDRYMVVGEVLPVRRDSMSQDDYIALLREHNRSRHKSTAEQVRETVVDLRPQVASTALRVIRDKSVFAPEDNGIMEVLI